jgi:segregation and condensation protein B
MFVYAEPIKLETLSEILEISKHETQRVLDYYKQQLENSPDRGLVLKKLAGGYQLLTKPSAKKFIEKFHEPKYRYPLSQASLETLAIICYRQPITRPEIDNIRGVNSDASLKTLIERGLIKESGFLQTPGKPILYSLTDDCLKYLGINSMDDLPKIDDLQDTE